MHVRSLGYRTDLMIRSLEGSQIDDRGDYLVVRSPANPSYWWGNFLLLDSPPEPGETGSWLEKFSAEFPHARHVALGIDVTETGNLNTAEMLSYGMHQEQTAVLTALEVREPPHPNAAAEIRALTGDSDWRQAAELRATVNEGEPGAEPSFLQARIQSERALTEAGHATWFGAFLSGKLVAQLGLVNVGSGIARYQNVETHPQARRQGLAGTLVWHAGQHGLRDRAATTLVMLADPHDVAIRIYRSVGFAVAETQLGFGRPPA
ncbi:MAG TPA: GNAT family N-acetyltransferase [Streptosporangiaceae bacterium]|nr:GNAT family N-acetyltransferase [Streptosporangiaceae bacterium]